MRNIYTQVESLKRLSYIYKILKYNINRNTNIRYFNRNVEYGNNCVIYTDYNRNVRIVYNLKK